jgi:serine/threonine protein kinase
MGIVFKAKDMQSERLVALKVLSPSLTRDKEAVRRFEHEVQLLGRLRHASLPSLLDAGSVDGLHYVSTEYVEGTNLKHLVQQHEKVRLAEAAELMRQTAEAVHAIHEQGVIHRDLKPSNILLSPSSGGTVRVTDFGLARALSPSTALEPGEEKHTTLGTLDYMAPEQWEDAERADKKSDLYSLGCTYYHLLTGRPPFSGPRYALVHQKRAGHKQEAPPPLEEMRPDVPQSLRLLIDRLLAKDPETRFASARELAHALEPFARGADLLALLRECSRENPPDEK